jgi:hypothetical protein
MLDVSSTTLLCSNFIFHLSFLDNFILFICLLNFFLDKEVNIPTYNLFETIHNIWLQQFGKRGTYFFATTSNDYM